MFIGNYQLDGCVILAPMAGITDRPFRLLCRRYGASLAVSEMISSNPQLQSKRKTLLRSDHAGEPEPRSIQILGASPQLMAKAARLSVAGGAQIIDINMGCPAKKVCNVAAGSALLRDEKLVASILSAVVKAVDVPVTLKIRTGWDLADRNAVKIATIAESSGVQAVAVHGRTRSCGFSGKAEYTTIAEIKSSIKIPVIANGDIDSPVKARFVLEQTGVDALMIGRAALGRPWLFAQVQQFLDFGLEKIPPDRDELQNLILEHLYELYSFYGEYAGVRIARKHIGWYLKNLSEGASLNLKSIFTTDKAESQVRMIKNVFERNFREIST
jgi:tRNA-dihydrouridine synthase B